MADKIRHRDQKAGLTLFNYQDFEAMSDCADRIVCLSEREFNLILQMLPQATYRTRVWTGRELDVYDLTTDSQWSDWLEWVNEIPNRLGEYLVCNEYLERIAISLENMEQLQDESTINLQDVIEAMGIEASETEADVLEALQYIYSLLPGLPTFNIPKVDFLKSIGDMRFRGAVLQLLQDIAISQRGQNVALGGVDGAALYDNLGNWTDRLLVKAGYLGKAYWIWRFVTNDQIPGWLGWLSSISALFYGSIRNATYNVVDAIESLDLAGVVSAIRESTDVTTVNCTNCAGQEITIIINAGDYPTGGVVDEDSTIDEGGDPPVNPDVPWDDAPITSDWKCQAARYVINWLISFFQSPQWALNLSDNLYTLTEKLKDVLTLQDAIHFPITIAPLLIGKILYGITSTGTNFVQEIGDVLDDLSEEAICNLYQGLTVVEGAGNVVSLLETDGRLNSWQIGTVDVLLKLGNLGGLLYFSTVDLVDAIESESDVCSCGTPIWAINPAICTANVASGDFSDGVPTVIESCVGNFFGTNRAGMNAGSNPTSTQNRQLDITSCTGGGLFYVILIDNGTPLAGVSLSAAQVASISGQYSGFQICRNDANDTTAFTITMEASVI